MSFTKFMVQNLKLVDLSFEFDSCFSPHQDNIIKNVLLHLTLENGSPVYLAFNAFRRIIMLFQIIGFYSF